MSAINKIDWIMHKCYTKCNVAIKYVYFNSDISISKTINKKFYVDFALFKKNFPDFVKKREW